jgi:hypothetical protein
VELELKITAWALAEIRKLVNGWTSYIILLVDEKSERKKVNGGIEHTVDSLAK